MSYTISPAGNYLPEPYTWVQDPAQSRTWPPEDADNEGERNLDYEPLTEEEIAAYDLWRRWYYQ
jgi:hypothetical protein